MLDNSGSSVSSTFFNGDLEFLIAFYTERAISALATKIAKANTTL